MLHFSMVHNCNEMKLPDTHRYDKVLTATNRTAYFVSYSIHIHCQNVNDRHNGQTPLLFSGVPTVVTAYIQPRMHTGSMMLRRWCGTEQRSYNRSVRSSGSSRRTVVKVSCGWKIWNHGGETKPNNLTM